MKEIGGYFEIEFSNIKLGGVHPNAVRLNTARNCLEYVLLANNYRKVFVPFYTCEVILEPIIKHRLNYEFYRIDENFEPLEMPFCKADEAFLYTNYFGVKDAFVSKLKDKVGNLIIDNSQALFAAPPDDTAAFYSLRKFVGIAGGAFLYSNKRIDFEIESASSANGVSHLYTRKDESASAGYDLFRENDAALSGLPIMKMSASTEAFLQSYDFEKNKLIRERNFLYLHNALQKFNRLALDVSSLNAPLCYPFLADGSPDKQSLAAKKIYIPTYWTNVLEWLNGEDGGIEEKLVKNLLPLPVDQRYGLDDLQFIIENLSSD